MENDLPTYTPEKTRSHAERLDEALRYIESEIDFDCSLAMQGEDKALQKKIEINKFIYSALEELTQLRARLAQLNEPVIDPVTGEKHHQCSPYNVERLKHMLKYKGINA